MKALIFIQNERTIKIYTPNMELIGRVVYCEELNKYVFKMINDRFLTIKRLKEIVAWWDKWEI